MRLFISWITGMNLVLGAVLIVALFTQGMDAQLVFWRTCAGVLAGLFVLGRLGS